MDRVAEVLYMCLRAFGFACVLVLCGAAPSFAQQPGPATLEGLLNSDEVQKPATAAEVDAGPKRPAGTVARPKNGVQHPDLDKAWADYDAAVTKAAEAIRGAINKQFDAATAKGDLDAAEKWQAALEKFEKAGEIPAEKEAKAAVSAAAADYKKAREDLTQVYEAVVKSLTMEKKIAEAKAVREEYRTIAMAAQNVVAQSPAVIDGKDRDPRVPRTVDRRQTAEGPVAQRLSSLKGTSWKYEHSGDIFTLSEGGRVTKSGNNAAFATWQVVDSQVQVRQVDGEWVDILVLSPDGMVLAGKNQRGVPVRAIRVPSTK